MNHPSLWRVAGLTLTIALVANVFLWHTSQRDDAFANTIAIASGIAAGGLVITRFWMVRYMGEALLLSLAIWVASAIWIATADYIEWENTVRETGFYLAFALLSLGGYLATRTATDGQ